MTAPSFTKACAALLMFAGALTGLAHTSEAAPSHGKNASADVKKDVTPPEAEIIGTINGQVLTERDVENRGRLFALSTGLTISPELMQRLRPQIIRQLVDERIKTQELIKRHINIPPAQIAETIRNIEARNGMPANALRNRLRNDGVSLTTLIDQIRVQLGWMTILRQEVGGRARITAKEIEQREAALKAEEGRPQYNVSEIFVPVADPRHPEPELEFTNTIISELRKGAPFSIVAAQFSRAQTALDGGALGWVQEDSLDPPVVAIVRAMPIGAISNPIKVAGGYDIVTVHARRTIGHQLATMVTLRQAFFPFTSPLNPQDPTEQQKQSLERATSASGHIRGCDAMSQLNKSLGEKRPSDPGNGSLLVLDRMNEQMKTVIGSLPIGQASKPLVSPDGIALIMVCSRDQKNIAQQTPSEIADSLLNERVEQASRQLERDLERRSVIKLRSSATERVL